MKYIQNSNNAKEVVNQYINSEILKIKIKSGK